MGKGRFLLEASVLGPIVAELSLVLMLKNKFIWSGDKLINCETQGNTSGRCQSNSGVKTTSNTFFELIV